ncbi:MAG TPA: acetolactate synthase small subunit [Polyangiaceae bacterium]|jgi:acetolactate synthase-1/3 small subunit|nr:acetolactate synthase small subunit [Polyangiaceae bacterium]
MSNTNRHVLSILVEDRFGELARIVGLFAGRGFNIDALAASRTLEPELSRVVLVTRGDDTVIEQIIKQVNKLLRVRKVNDMATTPHVERELCVVNVRAAGGKGEEELERILRLTGAHVLSHYSGGFTVELAATPDQIDSFLERLRPLGIRDMVRSAPIAIVKPAVEADGVDGTGPLSATG